MADALGLESVVEQVGTGYVVRRVHPGQGYGDRSITCLTCGLVSWNPHDIESRYCPRCSVFHDDAALAQRLAEEEAADDAP